MAGKIVGFKNISIPTSIDPMNYYIMIGKIEYMLYLNFKNDSFYFQTCSMAECFMSLYLPESKCETIEATDNYITFKITSYHVISSQYKDKNEIVDNFSNWLEIKKDLISVDKYDLFFWANIENHSFDFFNKDLKKYFEIEDYFVYLKLNINALIFDNIEYPYLNEINENFSDDKMGVGFEFTSCDFEVVEKSDNINYITWNQPKEWINLNNTINIFSAEVNGIGIYKITKQNFKNLTGIDLNKQISGKVNLESLKSFKINKPDIQPYNRLQYWLASNKF